MGYKVFFDKKAQKDLKNIDKTWQSKILHVISKDLAKKPYDGKRLLGNWSPFFRWRVGNYRIIYDIDDAAITIEIIHIRHRKEAY